MGQQGSQVVKCRHEKHSIAIQVEWWWNGASVANIHQFRLAPIHFETKLSCFRAEHFKCSSGEMNVRCEKCSIVGVLDVAKGVLAKAELVKLLVNTAQSDLDNPFQSTYFLSPFIRLILR